MKDTNPFAKITSALGNLILIVPEFKTKGESCWVVSFKRSGRWESASEHQDRKSARREVARIRRIHRELAKKWGPKIVEKQAKSE